jgi:predicted DNA-binding transcriptional regulator AlpA
VDNQQPLAGLTEVAALLGVSKRTASRYAAREDFPQPIAHLAMGPIWNTADIERWAKDIPVNPPGRPPNQRSH